MEKFEISTTVVNVTVQDKSVAMQKAVSLSRRFGKASIFQGYQKIAVFQYGVKIFEKK